MRLELGNCCVRPWRVEDATDLAHHANSREVWRNMRDRFPHPYTMQDAETFIAAARAQDPESFFAIAVDDRAVGGIGYHLLSDIERVGAELGYWLGVAYWGRGLMSACVTALTKSIFDSHPELRRVFAVPMAWNASSARVLEKAGYQFEGRMRQSAIKDGVVVDQLLYARLADAGA
jgi:[ribosomal protein S5]-alanine N-acetyltransferase